VKAVTIEFDELSYASLAACRDVLALADPIAIKDRK